MISPQGTQDIPHGTEIVHSTQGIPRGTHGIPFDTEHSHGIEHHPLPPPPTVLNTHYTGCLSHENFPEIQIFYHYIDKFS